MKWVINAGTGELEPINSAKLNLGQRFNLGGLAGRVGFKDNPLKNFVRNPGGINQYTKLKPVRTLVEIQAIIDNAPAIEIDGKFFEPNAKDLQGRSEYSGKELITRKEHEKYKDKLKYKSTGKKRIVLRSAATEKRTKWIKEVSDVTTEQKLAAPKKTGVELSHLGSKTGLVTPNNLAYLPKYTNKLSYHRFEKILNGIQADQRKILDNNKMTMDAKRKALAELAKADRTLRNRFKGLGYDKIKSRIKTRSFAWGIGETEVLKDPKIAIGKGEAGSNVALKNATKAEKEKIVKESKKLLKQIAKKSTKSAGAKLLYPAMLVNQLLFGDRFSKGPWDFPLTITEDVKQTNELLEMIGDKVNLAAGGRVSYLDGGIASLKK